MRRRVRNLLALHPDDEFLRRLAHAAGAELRLSAYRDWDSLLEAVPSTPAGSLIVVDPRFGMPSGGGIAPELRSLALNYPSTPIVAALSVGPGEAGDLRALGRLGVVEVLVLGHDETTANLRHRLNAAATKPLKLLLREVLPHDLSGRVRALLDMAAEVVVAGEHGRDLAQRLGLSRRTLLRWTDRAGIPPARQLLAWMRIMLAAALLDDPGRTVLSAAQAAGYSSDSGLRRITERFLGLSPTEMRRRGAFAGASKGFLSSLQRRRGEAGAQEAQDPGS